MTYKELVDSIAAKIADHKMVSDFGYGQLSDIKVLDEDGDGADYPYAFLLPTGANRSNNAMTYNFALIMMEMALNPTQILKVQSDCIQYLNDIVAALRFDDAFRGDLLLTQSIEVFRERFQDEVAGATANIQITVADTINECIAPNGEEPTPPVGTERFYRVVNCFFDPPLFETVSYTSIDPVLNGALKDEFGECWDLIQEVEGPATTPTEIVEIFNDCNTCNE